MKFGMNLVAPIALISPEHHCDPIGYECSINAQTDFYQFDEQMPYSRLIERKTKNIRWIIDVINFRQYFDFNHIEIVWKSYTIFSFSCCQTRKRGMENSIRCNKIGELWILRERWRGKKTQHFHFSISKRFKVNRSGFSFRMWMFWFCKNLEMKQCDCRSVLFESN